MHSTDSTDSTVEVEASFGGWSSRTGTSSWVELRLLDFGDGDAWEHLTPGQARAVAAKLLTAADEVEGLPAGASLIGTCQECRGPAYSVPHGRYDPCGHYTHIIPLR